MAFFSKTKIVTLAPLRNENAFQSFFDELHRLAASTRKNLVLDLSSLSENPGLDFGFMIEDAWLSLTERGLGMAVVGTAFLDTKKQNSVVSAEDCCKRSNKKGSPKTPLFMNRGCRTYRITIG